jgi:hypothetical protein
MSASSSSSTSVSSSNSSLSGGGAHPHIPTALRFAGEAKAFPDWKFHFASYMRLHRLQDVIEKPHPREGRAAASPMSQSVDNAAEEAKEAASVQSAADQLWDERADRAHAILVLCLATPALTSLARQVPLGDAHGVWKLLLARYERKTVISRSAVIQQLMNITMEPGEHVDLYVARMQSLETLMGEMGEVALSQSMRKHLLLQGLSPSFLPFVQSLGLHQGTLSFDEIVTHLVDQQEKLVADASSARRAKNAPGVREDVASYAQAAGQGWQQQQNHRGQNGGRQGQGQRSSGQGRQQNGRQQNASGRRCFGCDQEGHMAFDCPTNKSAIKCYLCRRLGHRDSQCPDPQRLTRRGGGQQQQQLQASNHPPAQQSAMAAVTHGAGGKASYDDNGDDAVFVAVTDFAGSAPIVSGPALQKSSGDVDEFILDSAATRHLVCDRRLLDAVQELTDPISLRIADGNTLELRQIGNCKLRTTVWTGSASALTQEAHSVTLTEVACDERIWCNLISMTRIVKAGYDVTCGELEAVVRHRVSGRIVMTVPKRGQLYVLSLPKVRGSALTDVGFTAMSASVPTPAVVVAKAVAPVPALHVSLQADVSQLQQQQQQLTESQVKRRARRAKSAAAPDAVRVAAQGDSGENAASESADAA